MIAAAALALSTLSLAACGEPDADPTPPPGAPPADEPGAIPTDEDASALDADTEGEAPIEDGDGRTPGEQALADDPDWPPFEETSAEITEADFHYWVRTLADDRFEGRAPGTETGEASAQWIADNLDRMGLQPAGEDGWFQAVPLIEATLDQERSSLDIAIDGEPMGLQPGQDSVYWTENAEELVTVETSDLVFVGYGVNAPEYGWNDYEGVDVDGRTVVILVNDPGYGDPESGLFNETAMTYYGRWTYKYEEAARQGAQAAIIVHQTEPASYGWDVVYSSWTGPQFTLQREGELELVPVQGWIQLDTARRLFDAVGLDFDDLAEAAARPGFQAVSLDGAQLSAELHTDLRTLTSNNVVGMIEGSERPDEYILMTAHWDHIGVRLNFASDDDIYNGAVDNATGVAAVLEMAERFASDETPPERSILALFVTAEEQGLLGSAWYAENPLVPLNQIVGGFNFDAMLPVGRTEDIVVIGYGSSEMEDILQDVVEDQGRHLSPDPSPEGGFFYRSDHISFARRGVPMLYAKDGSSHIEHGTDYVSQRATAYRLNAYHAPSDEYDPDWDMSGLVENTETAYEVARRLADSEDWPNWYEGNEFRSLRDAMMAERE